MSSPTSTINESLRDLTGLGLLVPSLQPQPQPIRGISPAPCTQKCPAGVQVKAYVSLIAEERFGEALEVIRRRCPLPGICGRICHHPCESVCRRQRYDDPIAIRALKRFVADGERDFPRPAPPPGDRRSARVAVIGSGPAGLTAAYDLSLAGYPVTVFEGESEAGGMLRYGITEYRLPRDILDEEIDVLVRAGVEIRTGMKIGGSVELSELLHDFDATLLAVGAQRGRRLGIEGERGGKGVEDALAFLRRVNAGDRPNVGRSVLVIGGGSSAIEAARTARRLGAESVQILYRRSQDELLAAEEEVRAAEAEGVEFRFLVAPLRAVRGPQGMEGLECAKVGLGELDASGRRRPIAIPHTEFVLPADRVLAAVGQDVDFAFLPARGRNDLVKSQRMLIDEATAMTRLSGVFAAGDMVTGPATVIEAIASGHRAAESIQHFIEEGRPGIREERPERHAAPEYELPEAPPLEAERLEPPVQLPQPGREFHEFEQAFDRAAAVEEARRCLRCGPCGECRTCASSCQRRHVLVRTTGEENPRASAVVRVPAAVALSIDDRRSAAGWLIPRAIPIHPPAPEPEEGISVELFPMRASVRQEQCRGCGECSEVCSFHAIHLEFVGDTRRAAVIDPALCRGCNLCTATCPTGAAVGAALSPAWWEEHLQRITSEDAGSGRRAVIACQRRAGAVEEHPELGVRDVEFVRLRCIGQLNEGLLLGLIAQGSPAVLVAGCAEDRCRFGDGARLARRAVRRAQEILRSGGLDPECVVFDGSDRRAHDPLGPTLLEFIRRKRFASPLSIEREVDEP